MKFLLYASINGSSIGDQLGAADYSYYFLLRAFAVVLQKLGDVIELGDASQADAIHDQCVTKGEECVLLSFAPPHKTPLGLECPVVPLFAWEYPNIPEHIEEKSWHSDPRNDWRVVLGATGRAICLSTHTAEAVRRSMGRGYPITAIPAPIPASLTRPRAHHSLPHDAPTLLRLNASIVDSLRVALDPNGVVHAETIDEAPFHPSDHDVLPEFEHARHAKPHRAEDDHADAAEGFLEGTPYSAPLPCGWEIPPSIPIQITLRGMVYTSVLTPQAGRKNWEDLITAFCWTFRDNEDATLILKLAGRDLSHNHLQLLMMLTKLSPFKCRVIAIYGYLSDEEYASLAAATTYYVNTSLCEGLCLPLVEFLNWGTPAIAPNNTAMADYINQDIAFVVKSYPGLPTVWPHGDHQINRTSYNQLDWGALVEAFEQSYDVAHRDVARYRDMSARAHQAMQAYCGNEVIEEALRTFFHRELAIERNRRTVSPSTRPLHLVELDSR